MIQLQQIDRLESSKKDFGYKTLLSADGSIMLIFSDVSDKTANVHVYTYDNNINKFNYYDTNEIEFPVDSNIKGDCYVNYSGSFFITSGQSEQNAKCGIYKINTTDRKNQTLYKVNDFDISNGADSVLSTNFNVVSEYITVNRTSSTTIYKYDANVKNFALVQTFTLVDLKKVASTEKSFYAPMIALTDTGEAGLLIYAKTGQDYGYIRARIIQATDSTHTKYTISTDFKSTNNDKLGEVLRSFEFIRTSSRIIFGVGRGEFIETQKTSGVYKFVTSFPYISLQTRMWSRNNYNQGLIVNEPTVDKKFIVTGGTFVANRGLETIDCSSYTGRHKEYDYNKNFIVAVSDIGTTALPVENKNNNYGGVLVYRDTNYPAIYKPVSYPKLQTDPDLNTPPLEPVADSTKFIVTYTFAQ